MSTFARLFLGAAWLLPCLCLLLGNLPDEVVTLYVPFGVGILDSGRILLFVLTALGSLFSLGSIRRRNSPVLISCLLFLAWTILSALLSHSPGDSLLFVQVWFSAVFFFVGVHPFVNELREPRNRLLWLHAPLAVLTVVALLPVAFDPDPPRVGGIFGLGGVFSNWLVLLFPLCLHDALKEEGRVAAGGLVASVTALVAVLFTYSRTGWLLISLECGLVTLVLGRVERRRFAVILALLLASFVTLILVRQTLGFVMLGLTFFLIVSLPVLVESLNKRVPRQLLGRLLLVVLCALLTTYGLSRTHSETLEQRAVTRMKDLRNLDNSSRARLELWQSALAMTRAHPITGVGPGNFSTYYSRFQGHFFYYSDSPHSASLELSSELGVVGLLLFLTAIAAFLKEAFRGAVDPFRRTSLVGFTIGLACAQVDVTYQFGYVWMTLALLAALSLPPPEPESSSGPWLKAVQFGGTLACFIFVALLYPPVRRLEIAKLAPDGPLSLEYAEMAQEGMPWSDAATIVYFQRQFKADPKNPKLPALLPRMLQSDSATAHALAGDYLKSVNQLDKALEEYRRAIAIDPYNYPDFYRSVLDMAGTLEDDALMRKTENQVLSVYRLDELALAHGAHRFKLNLQLHPLLYQIADNINPFYHPERTEPIYRYLVQEDGSPRAYYGLGVSLWTDGQYEEAREYLRRAHEMNSVFPAPPS